MGGVTSEEVLKVNTPVAFFSASELDSLEGISDALLPKRHIILAEGQTYAEDV